VKKDATGIANGSGWRSRRSGGSSTYWLPALQFAGHQKVQAEWQLVCAALNLKRIAS